VATREAWVRQMQHLADQGCDYLARALARCRAKRIVPGVTVRMNDMHDAPTPGTHLFSRFYMEHPDLRLDNPAACGWSAKGLNYEHAAVRDHYLALIRELVAAYDVEWLELDFLRFHCYFPRDRCQDYAAIMTGFLRQVRALLDRTGRRIALTARLAAHPAAARELGFDVGAWARERLVDGVSAGAFLNTQWQIAVGEYRTLVGDDVAVYACTDYTADRRPGLPVRKLPIEPEMLRGFAAGHLAAGASGVELFNFFCAREEVWEKTPRDPSFATLRELRSLDGLRGTAKTYTLTAGWSVGETDGPLQVPTPVEAGQPRAFHLLLAAEQAPAGVDVVLAFTGAAAVGPEQLWLQVNHIAAGPAVSVELLPAPAEGVRRARFDVPAEALRDGRNEVVVRNEGETLTVVSLDVRVQPGAPARQAGLAYRSE
jgi:hypothetical protein